MSLLSLLFLALIFLVVAGGGRGCRLVPDARSIPPACCEHGERGASLARFG